MPQAAMNDTLVYVGTYTKKAQSKGIYLFRLQTSNLEVSQNITLVPLGVAAEVENPSFLEVDLKRRLLFAVNEIDSFQGKPTGAVSAFKMDPGSGKLTLLNQRSSMGQGPCHLALDKTGKNLLVANYDSGSVALLPVAADGKLGEASQVVQHSGKSVHPERQKGPHAHCVKIDPGNRFAFVCDLGLDKVIGYPLDADKGKLAAEHPVAAQLKPGSGPRHMVFRPDGRFAYVLNELTSTVTAFACDGKTGALKELQTLRTVPESYDGPNTGAEIDVHPSGKFLYSSNRGHNSVVLFNIDGAQGTLSYVEEQGTGGKTPRNFRHRALRQAPGHRQPGVRHRAGLPDRRRQRSAETVGGVCFVPRAGLCEIRSSARMTIPEHR
jgi:6-phosphogluconolactonase